MGARGALPVLYRGHELGLVHGVLGGGCGRLDRQFPAPPVHAGCQHEYRRGIFLADRRPADVRFGGPDLRAADLLYRPGVLPYVRERVRRIPGCAGPQVAHRLLLL